MNVYDFDKTIYNGDSSVNFYLFCLKKDWKLIRYSVYQLLGIFGHLLKLHSKERMKELYFSFIKGIDNIDILVEMFWDKEQNKIFDWYLNQKKVDDVIISASPRFLLETIMKRLDLNNLIASEVDKKTAKFNSLNCYGEEKVRRYREVFDVEINNFFSDSFSDEPLASISKKAYLIKNGKIKEWK